MPMSPSTFGIVSAVAAAAVLQGSSHPLVAQHPIEGMEWSVSVLRPSGQLVTPIFEGWYRNEDGTYTLSFGYYSMNTEEVVEIPLGPDNFIEPAEYDGLQPTRFDPVPENGARRHWGVFTVRVPGGFGDQRVVWTLRHHGKTFSIPGHITSMNYILDSVEAPARGTSAASMKFQPSGPSGRGPHGIMSGPIEAKVGVPLPISVWVDPSPRPSNLVWWFKHQGPGEVRFSMKESEIEGPAEVTTTAAFTEPGDYILRVKAVESIADIEFHCCWTNGYVRVRVSE
jgi:hypothetical protein